MRRQLLSLLRSPGKWPPIERLLRGRAKGKPATSFWGRCLPNPYDYSPGSWREAAIGGAQLRLDLHQMVDWHTYFRLADPAQDQLFAAAGTGHVVLDIGANIGVTVFQLAARVGPTGHVHAFEPNPLALERLRAHAALNPDLPVSLYPIGLSDAPGTLHLEVPEAHNLGMAHMATDGKGLAVAVKTLDDWTAEATPARVDLIKIDVEGWEYHVLKGGQQLLQTHRPKLFFEADAAMLARSGASWADLIQLLTQLGYRLHPGHAPNGPAIDPETMGTVFHVDLWAIPTEN